MIIKTKVDSEKCFWLFVEDLLGRLGGRNLVEVRGLSEGVAVCFFENKVYKRMWTPITTFHFFWCESLSHPSNIEVYKWFCGWKIWNFLSFFLFSFSFRPAFEAKPLPSSSYRYFPCLIWLSYLTRTFRPTLNLWWGYGNKMTNNKHPRSPQIKQMIVRAYCHITHAINYSCKG